MSVEGEKVLEPQAPPPLPENNPVEWDKDRRTHQALVDNFNTQKALYNSLASEASDVRTRETETRQVFADACSAVIGNPVWKELRGALFPDLSAGGGVAAGKAVIWANSVAQSTATLAEGAGLKATDAVVKHPMRGKPNKWVTSHEPRRGTPKGVKPYMVRNDRHLSNWEVPKGKSGGWGGKTVAAVKKAAPYLDKVSKGFVAVDVAVGGYEQWEKDSHNPSLPERGQEGCACGNDWSRCGSGWSGWGEGRRSHRSDDWCGRRPHWSRCWRSRRRYRRRSGGFLGRKDNCQRIQQYSS